ncbi:MAG: fused MFS/spermidine synthase [Terracidiphilus sp.]
MLLVVFTLSMFVSATLLFLVEPMLAKMALPMLGGTPAVWNTCLVFFQTVLLAGYLYAYAVTKWLRRSTQILLQIVLALTALIVLPLHLPIGWEPPVQGSPVLWVLAMLAVTVGLPFFLLSSSTPMLQRWFSQSGDKSAHDPYFLYAASNGGSLVGLLGYPLFIEPTLHLSIQSYLWSYGYVTFIVLTVFCGALVWRRRPSRDERETAPQEEVSGMEPRAAWRQRLRWIALAFVPSSLMMGVTTALTTDIPAIPLIWVMPLALYLLSFVLVFAKRPLVSHENLILRLPILLLFTLFPILSGKNLGLLILFPLYLSVLFVAAMVCHGEIANNRPGVSRLAEFYLWISFGGVLGGIFNALLAPQIFSSVFEFPLALIFAAFLLPAIDPEPVPQAQAAKHKRNDLLLPLSLGLSMVAITLGLAHFNIPMNSMITIVFFGGSMIWCLSFAERPMRFATGMVVLVVAGSLFNSLNGKLILQQRSFFGVLRVSDDPESNVRNFIHGAIVHGTQSLDPAKSREPMLYYAKSGPAGSILRAVEAKTRMTSTGDLTRPNWAVVGLGSGAMACYLQPGESLTFYEIDPAVVRIASNPRYFTYLSQCAPRSPVVIGDARLKLRYSADASYDLIVLDAFSGDVIPMHLMTREALALYLRKLAPGGILAFHISNGHLKLAPIFGALARDAGLVCLRDDDLSLSKAETGTGRSPSEWLVMARSRADLGILATDPRWTAVSVPPGADLWTDDFSNLLRVIKINWGLSISHADTK